MKENEKRAAELLNGFLTGKLNLKASWKPGDNPPDFVFTVNSEQWAVEETQLHQYVQLRNKPESRKAIEEPLASMCERIKAEAKPTPNRDYLIGVFGPIEDKKLGDIEETILEHIQSEQLEDYQVTDSVRVEVHASEPRIEYMIGLRSDVKAAGGQAIAADVGANLEFALTRVLDEKLPILEKLEGYERRIRATSALNNDGLRGLPRLETNPVVVFLAFVSKHEFHTVLGPLLVKFL